MHNIHVDRDLGDAPGHKLAPTDGLTSRLEPYTPLLSRHCWDPAPRQSRRELGAVPVGDKKLT